MKAKRNYRLQPRVIDGRGEVGRRVIKMDGWEYHVTKGWRRPLDDAKSSVDKPGRSV